VHTIPAVETTRLPRLLEGRYTTKKDLVLDWFREAIVTGELQAGQHVPQEELAERLGVSITPVREAISELRAAGLLTQNTHRGARVADTDARVATDLHLLRSTLEPLAARRAVAHLTETDLQLLRQLQARYGDLVERGESRDLRKLNYQFHMSIYRAADSPLLLDFIAQLWARVPLDILSALPDRSTTSLREHEQILRALERREVEAAEHLTREHIAHGAEALLEVISRSPQRGARNR
jgi:DNA-binding GntR family transcriptional regulator